MISRKCLLDIIATEVIEGWARDHYFDEFRNRDYILPEPERRETSNYPKLPPIRISLELIKNPDGSYEWVE